MFDNIVFAGGGSRCVWQGGFWSVLSERVAPPSRVAGVSAGAAMACIFFAGKYATALQAFKKSAGQNSRNFYPKNLIGKKPVFPQPRIYRDLLTEVIDHDAMAILQKGPEIRVMVSRIPTWAPSSIALVFGMSLYSLEKKIHGPVHPKFGQKFGFTPEIVTVQSCQSPDELMDLILASSCTPPITPFYRFGGRTALDGGLVDNVPILALGKFQGSTLVMLSRRYSTLPEKNGVRYVQPSEELQIAKWDYTNPDLLQKTYDLGRKDAEAYLATKNLSIH